MCRTTPVEIEEIPAFKIFCKDADGRFISAFAHSYKNGLFYETNKRVFVDTADAEFFAFENFDDAISIAKKGKGIWFDEFNTPRYWNFKTNDIVVLPVTLYNVVGKGNFHVPSEDLQCMDGYYPIYTSKEITIHYSIEFENAFYDAILRKAFKWQLHMSNVEKQAFAKRLPQYLEVKK